MDHSKYQEEIRSLQEENMRLRAIGMIDWQTKMVSWVKTRLGSSAMDTHERGMRFLEESLELVQAVGITEEEIEKVRQYVFSKPIGRVVQEIGGVVTTLLTLAQSQDVDMNIAGLMEIDRIHALPPEKFRKRQNLNASLGIGAQINTLEEKR
jgi:hypothetical protein